VVTCQLQVERRTAKEHWPETDVLPLCRLCQNIYSSNTLSQIKAILSFVIMLNIPLSVTFMDCVKIIKAKTERRIQFNTKHINRPIALVN